MLRASLSRGGRLVLHASRPIAASEWLAANQGVRALSHSSQLWVSGKGPTPVILPGSESKQADDVPKVPRLQTTPASTSVPIIPAANVPRTPVTVNATQTAPPTKIPPPSISPVSTTAAPLLPPPPPPKRKRRFRRFLLLTLLSAIAFYAGGTYYALINDNFHDFFTEFVPLGEECVLFWEERDFQKRFPTGSSTSNGGRRLYPQTSGENKLTVAGKSGVTARDARPEDKVVAAPAEKATAKPIGAVASGSTAKTSAAKASVGEAKAKAEAKSENPLASGQQQLQAPAGDQKSSAKAAAPQPPASSPPASSPPKADGAVGPVAIAAPPIALLDHSKIANAEDPVVQEVAKILNDLISAVNADNASDKYSSSIDKAKDQISKIAAAMSDYRSSERKAAEDKLRAQQAEFDENAKTIMARIQQERREDEMKFREEYEAERERLSESYHNKLRTEIEATQKVAEQRLKNEMLQREIAMKDDFTASIRKQVETERDARLSKLNELNTAVSEMEKLTGQWNEVVDANLKTQHLVVAVDAVRSILDSADRPKPFLHELAALKEIAHDDGVVNAAIASLNPTTYQKGIPTGAQLIDRFRRVAGEVRKAALLPEDAGVASHVASFVLSKVMFKKNGLAVGDDVESVLTRTETLLEEGHLDQATREMNMLTGWAKVLSSDWLNDCRKVLEVKQALDVIAAEARLQSLLLE